MAPSHHRRSSPRGAVIIVVLWALAIAGIVTSAVQLFSFRQAALGQETLGRVQARWAARAGFEDTLTVFADHTERPAAGDAKLMFLDLEAVSSGDTFNATYDIRHQVDGRDVKGPLDEQSRMNINLLSPSSLMALDNVTIDIVDALRDWTDTDDQVSIFGVEADWYLSKVPPYQPRNSPLRSTLELELVAGFAPEDSRGEDWNLNNRLDPGENDGNVSLPPDDRDGQLDYGWIGSITTSTFGRGGATQSGLPRIRISKSTPEEIAERIGVNEAQAQAIINFAGGANARLDALYTQPLSGTAGTPQQEAQGAPAALTDEQIIAVQNELSIAALYDRQPGKININTVSADLLRRIFELREMDESLVDELIYLRDSRANGIADVMDFRRIPDLSDQDYAALVQLFCTTSNVFTISSRGRSWATGLECEIIATVDRSTVPVTILSYREQ